MKVASCLRAAVLIALAACNGPTENHAACSISVTTTRQTAAQVTIPPMIGYQGKRPTGTNAQPGAAAPAQIGC